MKPFLRSPYAKVAGLGLLTGIRVLSGPAMILPSLLRPRETFFSFRPAKPDRFARIMKSLAIAESIGDKLPIAPDRISKAPLLGRTLFGSLTGVMAYKAFGKKDGLGLGYSAIIGGAAAIAGAHGAYFIRKWAGKFGRTPDILAGLGEDLLVAQAGRRILA
jgi:uncharacterized membrane protein